MTFHSYFADFTEQESDTIAVARVISDCHRERFAIEVAGLEQWWRLSGLTSRFGL